MEGTVLFLIIFLFTDVMTVGIVSLVYSGKERYSEGMILGVHIPADQVEHEEVQAISGKYKRQMKAFQRWNMLLGILVCGFAFVKITICMLIWGIWLTAYIIGLQQMIYRPHRKLYQLKVEKGWIVESARRTVYIDTEMSALSDRMPISKWHYVPPFILTVGVLALPSVQKFLKAGMGGWTLFWISLGVNVFFFVFHLWIERRQNVVYSKNSSINQGLNRLVKRTWTLSLLGCTWIHTLAWLYMVVCMIKNQWLDTVDFFVYVMIESIAGMVLLYGLYQSVKKKKEILAYDTEQIETDDDEYWKNGWYNNPNDPHLWVQDRLCSTNYSMNMAKPAAKVISVITAVAIGALIIWVLALVVELETAKVSVAFHEKTMEIEGLGYECEVNADDIISLELLETLPNDKFYKSNGADTEKCLFGNFKGRDTGKCMMFLYRNESPVLKIQLEDITVFLNSEEEEETKDWYDDLTGRMHG